MIFTDFQPVFRIIHLNLNKKRVEESETKRNETKGRIKNERRKGRENEREMNRENA
jgi:hypothetical protein